MPEKSQSTGFDGAESTCVEGSAWEARMRTRMTANIWEKKWQNVLIEMNFEVGIWSPEIMCCCGVCGHEDDLLRI